MVFFNICKQKRSSQNIAWKYASKVTSKKSGTFLKIHEKKLSSVDSSLWNTSSILNSEWVHIGGVPICMQDMHWDYDVLK